ncbi:MAG TPA: hypothetical protein VIM73_07620 [Polyangiaceae bacterium]
MKVRTRSLLWGLGGLLVLPLGYAHRTHTPDEPRAQSDAPSAVQHGERLGEIRQLGRAPINHDESPETAALSESDVLTALETGTNLDDANVLLIEYFRNTPWKDALQDRARWRAAILKLLKSSQALPQGLAARLGRLLREVGTADDRAALATDYMRGEQGNESLRLATLESSSSRELLRRALTDAEPSLAVKESALRRLAALGESNDLRDVFKDTTQPSAVRVSSLQELGKTAAGTSDLKELVEMGSELDGADEYGRLASNIARVATSEAKVGGKALVLFENWSILLDRFSAGTARASVSEGMVASIALSRALWSDPDRAAAEQLIRHNLLPSLTQRLKRAQEKKEGVVLQILVEFGAAYVNECESRPEPACEMADDARSILRRELAEVFAPYLSAPELADMAARLRI